MGQIFGSYFGGHFSWVFLNGWNLRVIFRGGHFSEVILNGSNLRVIFRWGGGHFSGVIFNGSNLTEMAQRSPDGQNTSCCGLSWRANRIVRWQHGKQNLKKGWRQIDQWDGARWWWHHNYVIICFSNTVRIYSNSSTEIWLALTQ